MPKLKSSNNGKNKRIKISPGQAILKLIEYKKKELFNRIIDNTKNLTPALMELDDITKLYVNGL